MTRKLAAVLTVLAVIACFGRVSAWAAASGDAHACCNGESSTPAKAPTLSECCPVSAAASAVKPLAPELTFVVVTPPALTPSFSVESVESDASGPPGPDALLSSVPARAPPLA